MTIFIHRAKIRIKPNSFIELSRKMQNEIMPVLRLEKGYCSSNVSMDRQCAASIEDTYWETQEAAKHYQQTGFLKLLKTLSEITVGEPVTSIFESSETTFSQSKAAAKTL